MYCKKWLNTEEILNYQKKEKMETEIIENSNKIETKIIKNNNEVLYVDKSMLWWII